MRKGSWMSPQFLNPDVFGTPAREAELEEREFCTTAREAGVQVVVVDGMRPEAFSDNPLRDLVSHFSDRVDRVHHGTMDQNNLGQGSGGQESLKERKVKDFTVAKDPDTTSWQTASGISRKDCAFVARLKPSHKVAIQTHCDRDRFLSGDGSPFQELNGEQGKLGGNKSGG